ncbi:UPF0415 protein C7orf25 [Neocloeon triangulifer]|uniref:UPF0415 protein C7orf25 n=1 Tax=Neocloeon triangulifer TaxID=2078957 RepID=UPI00286F97CA|nr:UPF0415 protein C7orf25 [Neocloeon triangulifer]
MSLLEIEELRNALEEKISLGEELIARISHLANIEGIGKLHKKVKQEINFLQKVISKSPKKEHLMCTNLHHFTALVIYMESHYADCVSTLQNFHYRNTEEDLENGEIAFGASPQPCKITVDVVTHKRQIWVKVIARNPRALTQLSAGAGKYGQKSILDQADLFVSCAKKNPVLYCPPKVIFYFSNGIEENLARHLEAKEVIVEGTRITDCSWQEASDDEEEDEEEASSSDEENAERVSSKVEKAENNSRTINRLNLDVSTMVAYVSALTNGRNCYQYKQPLLMQQAEWERARPVKPVLDKLFEGKELFCCKSAERDFMKIVNTMAGPGEKERAKALMTRVVVVPDELPPRVAALILSAKVKSRSQIVFGTGDALKAVTVSANEGFVRGAQNQGVDFVVYLHESRALTEAKEQSACPSGEDVMMLN